MGRCGLQLLQRVRNGRYDSELLLWECRECLAEVSYLTLHTDKYHHVNEQVLFFSERLSHGKLNRYLFPELYAVGGNYAAA